MARFVIALAAIGAVIASFVIDWRAAGLLLFGWWLDNVLRHLREREQSGG